MVTLTREENTKKSGESRLLVLARNFNNWSERGASRRNKRAHADSNTTTGKADNLVIKQMDSQTRKARLSLAGSYIPDPRNFW